MRIKTLSIMLWFTALCFGQIKYETFSKHQLEEDFAYFLKKVVSIHPVLLDKNIMDKWKENANKVKTQVHDGMTQNEFYLIIAPLLATLNDGHSNVLCPIDQRKQYMMSGGLAFPFNITIHDNTIFITEYFGEDSSLFKGREEITRINGIPSHELLDTMRKLTGGSSKTVKNSMVEYYFRTLLWMVYNFERDYQLGIKDSTEKEIMISVKGITNERFLAYMKQKIQKPDIRYSLTIDDSTLTAFFTIQSFADLDGFCAFADSIFPVIAAHEINNLVIDIRGNGGGRSIVIDSLMNYLTDKPYAQYKTIQTRVSEDLLNYYKEKYHEKYETYKDYPVNELVTYSPDQVTPHNNPFRFKGRLFLLTDAGTYSGAATFAGLFKEIALGIIIGEETGGNIEYYGDFWYITLPNTGLQFHIAPKRFVQFGGQDLNRGVIPHFVVPNRGDAITDFTKDYIERQ
ncbi:MAG: hypothetical protein JXB49_17840 [Bacteroidales bacterium]|nr:hypothetical protein [Bacteroidales bacterium]